MARRRRALKRKVIPDPVYGSDTAAKFINTLMESGKKSVAERIFYGGLEKVAEKTKSDSPLEIFYKALENVGPAVEVKGKRVGGSTYQIPVEVRPDRRMSLAMRWLIESAKIRSGKSMAERLAAEIMDACESRGGAFKKKEDTHRMAAANKAFAHYKT